MTKLTVSNRTGAEVKGDALVLVSVQTEECAALAPGHGLGKETVAHLESALSTLKARGKSDEVIKLVSVPGVAAALVVVTGAGKVVEQGASLQAEAIRRAVGSATRQLGGLAKVAVVAPGESVAEAAATAEGALLGAYAIATAAAGPNSGPVKSITVVTPAAQDKDLRTAVKRAIALGQATAYARDLVNQAPNELFPETFAALVKAPVGTSSPNQLADTVLARAILAGTDYSTERLPVAAGAALAGLQAGDLIKVTPDQIVPSSGVVFLGGPVKGSAKAETEVRLAAYVQLARVLDANGSGVVVVARSNAADRTRSADLVAEVRKNSDAAKVISTVDEADLPMGQGTLVLALGQQYSGLTGQYGLAPDAKAVVPDLTAKQ